VRRDHRALSRRQAERFARGEIDARLRLVIARDFGAENGVPMHAVAAREIGHQRDVAVRYRRQQEFLAQARESRRDVAPHIEPVPRQREIVQHRLG